MMQNRSIGKNISYIARALSRYIDQETKHLQLSNATVPFLTYLYEHEGIHQDEMAKNLQFDKSSAARSIKTLETLGYIKKITDRGNKRRNIVTVTELGRGIQDELYSILRECTKHIFTGFSQEEIELYFAYTEKINKNVMKMLHTQRS
jgi:DNA-binding MarR family transcriptional regulator